MSGSVRDFGLRFGLSEAIGYGSVDQILIRVVGF